MSYHIEYTLVNNKGPVRDKNQDNFWCMGEYLDSENEGLANPITGETDTKSTPAFAVFDGMGGEQYGEVAAYIAAKIFDQSYRDSPKRDEKQFLINACCNMNNAICKHVEEQHIRSSGSTAAILLFGKTEIYICNVGDSRIYQFNNGILTQISLDHSQAGVTAKKPPLTQNLGIPESEFIVQPYMAMGAYANGDIYLICSDGLTDMVSDDEIQETLQMGSTLTDSANVLINKALDSGGYDNITIILSKLHKQKLKLLNRFIAGGTKNEHRKVKHSLA